MVTIIKDGSSQDDSREEGRALLKQGLATALDWHERLRADQEDREDRQRRVQQDLDAISALRDEALASVREIDEPQARAKALIELVRDCGALRARAVRDHYARHDAEARGERPKENDE